MAVNGIKIEVGQVWRTRSGVHVTVHVTVHSIDEDPKYLVNVLKVGDGRTYSVNQNGYALPPGEPCRRCGGDLVELVLRAPNGITPNETTQVAIQESHDTQAVVASGGGKLERKANYYQVDIVRPVDPESAPYLAECADIIEALNMTFNEGEAFKALWRLAAARQGRAKAGGNPVYDADKVAHYGARTAAHTRAQKGGAA